MARRFYIETYGCQMNKYDSELMAGILAEAGYLVTDDLESADVILVNTCAVREHAEQRVFGRLGELKRYKLQNPDVRLGVCGCMAQRLGKKITEKARHVDLVVGPDAYRSLSSLLENPDGRPLVETACSPEEAYSGVVPVRRDGLKAWVAIIRGCNNFCSYCIVPYVRGPARSRPYKDILEEISAMAAKGYKEVTLLGQNVNAYRDGPIGFGRLLRMADEVEGLERVRFTTSHPRDMSPEIFGVIATGHKLCEHLHLPVQSGSTRMLKAMNRGYAREDYLRLVEMARAKIPGVSITTDLIVGFPGESGDDFAETVNLMEEVRFDSAFTFKYSPRPGTRAAAMADDVPEPVKLERLETLIGLQREITDRKNKGLIGKTVEVLVEGESRKGNGQLTGRTRTDKTVVFANGGVSIGSLVEVEITDAKGWTLFGRARYAIGR